MSLSFDHPLVFFDPVVVDPPALHISNIYFIGFIL